MSHIDAISPVAMDVSAPLSMESTASPTASNFGQWLAKEVSETNDKIISSDMKLRELALGDADNLQDVMLSLEQAKLSFEMIVQVRNRFLDAYQELMRMQI